MRKYGDTTGKRMESNHRDVGSPPYLDLLDSRAIHVKVGIFVWRHPKYLLEANYENENDAKFFSKKNGFDDFSSGCQLSTHEAHFSLFPLKSLQGRTDRGS